MAYSVRTDPRLAGEITRYHTWPRVREQSIGEHSWQLARIVQTVWPWCPKHVLVYCIFHDLGEMGTGDVPFPIKRDNPDLKRVMDTLEQETILNMFEFWGMENNKAITDDEKRIVKLCELLEMTEWAHGEVARGNLMAWPVVIRCEENFSKIYGEIHQTLGEVGPRLLVYREAMEDRFRTWRSKGEY
jgi:5'-deoxynucleotidase YfbR-like HD superfamily hydrolase